MLRMLQSIYSGKVLMTNPDRFFAELSGRGANLLVPFVIVLIGAVISAVSTAMMPYSSGAAAAKIAVGFVAPFIAWFLFAGAFYVISTMLGGVGSFRRVFEFTGYGFIPQIPSAILNALLLPVLLPLLSSCPQFMMYAIAIISLLLSLWSVAIWAFAVKHACNISAQDALFTVVGSVVAGWLLLWGLAYIMSGIMN